MTLSEATLAQPLDTPADLDPPPSGWLPLTAADVALERAERQPEHGWPGSLYVFLANLTAIGCGLGAIGMSVALVVALAGGGGIPAWMALLGVLGLSLGCVVQRALAKHVKHFTRWGWYGVMMELGIATLAKVNVLIGDPTDFVGPVFGIVIDLLWMNYFWERRADFDIDLSI